MLTRPPVRRTTLEETVASLRAIRSELLSDLASPRRDCTRAYADRVRQLAVVGRQLSLFESK